VGLPFRTPGIHPPPAGIDEAERQGAAWMYSGILAEAPPPVGAVYAWRGAYNVWHRSSS
jgi:hypothetical protein